MWNEKPASYCKIPSVHRTDDLFLSNLCPPKLTYVLNNRLSTTLFKSNSISFQCHNINLPLETLLPFEVICICTSFLFEQTPFRISQNEIWTRSKLNVGVALDRVLVTWQLFCYFVIYISVLPQFTAFVVKENKIHDKHTSVEVCNCIKHT